MTPTTFPAANATFGAPEGIADTQVQTISAYHGRIERGSMEGAVVIVTAWKPDARELAALNAGEPLFLSFIGILPPHFPTVSFREAISPA